MTVLRSIDNADRKAGGDCADHPALDRHAHRLVTGAVLLVWKRALGAVVALPLVLPSSVDETPAKLENEGLGVTARLVSLAILMV